MMVLVVNEFCGGSSLKSDLPRGLSLDTGSRAQDFRLGAQELGLLLDILDRNNGSKITKKSSEVHYLGILLGSRICIFLFGGMPR